MRQGGTLFADSTEWVVISSHISLLYESILCWEFRQRNTVQKYRVKTTRKRLLLDSNIGLLSSVKPNSNDKYFISWRGSKLILFLSLICSLKLISKKERKSFCTYVLLIWMIFFKSQECPMLLKKGWGGGVNRKQKLFYVQTTI